MNRIATVILVKRYKDLSIYSLKFDGETLCELQKFTTMCFADPKLIKPGRAIARWIEDIGSIYGGAHDSDLFRGEGLGLALPPDPDVIENGPFRRLHVNKNLRLYCMWVSKSVLIFFNGGLKTTQYAQDCPNVGKHFRNMQKYIMKLDEIGIRHNFRSITNLQDLFIEVDVEE